MPNTGAENITRSRNTEVITLGAGCFWCTEAVFKQLPGVHSAIPGYMGGHTAHPTYEEVVTGQTGHVEVVQIRFDPETIAFETLLEFFWQMHDPTSLDRQGEDAGSQYRSVIFFNTPEQKEASLASCQRQISSGRYSNPIVTQIIPAGPFFEAEKYHRDYYQKNLTAPYCRYVIHPKLKRLGLGTIQ